jgi:hypothetical protein
MLTEDDAVKIYEIKLSWRLQPRSDVPSRLLRGKSGPVAKLFGVSSRTIRDIWNRQAWTFATRRLWCRESTSIEEQREENSNVESHQVFFKKLMKSVWCFF